MKLKLILPTKKYSTQIEKYKQNFIDANSSFDGTSTLKTDDIDTWFTKCNDYRHGKNLPKEYVPATPIYLH